VRPHVNRVVVDDRALNLGEPVRFWEGRLRNAGMGILATKLGDDVVAIVLRAEAFSFEHFDNGRDLQQVGNRGFLEGHGFTFGAVVAQA
jgi:hypothetical protein